MNANQDQFCERLDYYIQFPDPNTALQLYQACGWIWNDTSEMPINARSDVSDVVNNYVEFEQWETAGRTFSGAARRIRPALKQKFSLQ